MNPTHSPEYAALQRQFHKDRPDYGISGARYAEQIYKLATSLKTQDILDYGCGKATLSKNLPFAIQNYDPFIPAYATLPKPADIVVCTDVMEHVEEEFIDNVLEEIMGLTKKVAFFQIATRPASKVLPDGRNAHITQHDASWWLSILIACFRPVSFQDMNGGFIFIGAKE